jgi:hypothetical protein
MPGEPALERTGFYAQRGAMIAAGVAPSIVACGNEVSRFSVRKIKETVRRVFGETQMRLVKARVEKPVGTSFTKNPLEECEVCYFLRVKVP